MAFVAVSLGAYFTYKKRKNQMAIMVPTSSAITRSNTLPSTKLSLMEWRDGDLNLKEIVAGGACYAGVYTDVCEKDAVDLILYQYEKGIRSFDVACHYGKGVAETRLGLAYKALGKQKMQDVQTCTKVGRYLVPKNTVQETLTSKAEGNPHICEEEAEAIFHNGDESVSQLRDYSYGGIRESYSQSLKRLQLSEYAKDGKLNMILRVHDCEDEKSFELAEQSIAALQDLKKGVTDDDGVLLPKVSQIGIGMNDNHYIDKFIALHEQMVRDTTLASSSGYRLGRGFLDNIISAGNWNLWDQSGYESFVRCQKNGIDVHLAGVYAGGFVFKKPYRYGSEGSDAPDDKQLAFEAWSTLCNKWNVSMPAVALKFGLLPKVVTRLIIGMSTKTEVDDTLRFLEESQNVPMDLLKKNAFRALKRALRA